ncbi:unnamed protein product [Acanthoscelides obtectus]|uniref:Uncharacterized protein n=1 Tax=Acanthoscelides obtectus TaxID=200917 RepID=A0A9P0LQD6_ACAOB|nr:unnamed protein product [Acanthoscelides obtectus]CAK1669490.1 Beta-1,4-glucuronyltransferase 1 [Acanthoscelides obtectus]
MYAINRKYLLLKIALLACVAYAAVHVILTAGGTGAGDNAAMSDGPPSLLRGESQEAGRMLAALEDDSQGDAGAGLQLSVGGAPPETTRAVAAAAARQAAVQQAKPVTTKKPLTVREKVKEITQCLDRPMVPKTQQRGDYWVLYNYVRADRRHHCYDSITYTTHADYSFLDNLVPLLERWQGPISIALHAPGTDFEYTIESIAYLRECTTPLVKEFVTFHVYFSTKHVPKEVPKHDALFQEPYNCSQPPPYLNVSSENMYKAQKKLLYPVNVGRNVARESAQTHYVLPSDIELYPSPNIIEKFLEMIAQNTGPLLSKNPKVFPLHIFEVGANQSVPETKTQLKEMLATGVAVPFHKKLCPGCHGVPKAKEWQMANETNGLHVFHVGKRNGRFVHWEPIFIGTHADPLYDERLSWEGKSDKMTQVNL